MVDKETFTGFGVKQIINSLSMLFLLTHIGLNLNQKCWNNRAKHKNLDLSNFFLCLLFGGDVFQKLN